MTTVEELETVVTALKAETTSFLEAYGNSNTNLWLMFGAILVFFMQTGFAMLEVGMVNIKNTKNILLKNLLDASLGSICWWLIGMGIAAGTSNSVAGFIGTDGFGFPDGDNSTKAAWLFQWAFSATAATIVSGAVAERVTFGCYVVYSVCLTCFIYPVVVHWGWNGGWGGAWRETDLFMGCGVTDFAGSGVVHLTGAVAALVGAKIIGPRIGRFDEGIKLPQQSVVFQTLGTLILWMGWYGFNGCSTLMLAGFSEDATTQLGGIPFDFSSVASHAMVTTTLSAASCCITTILLTYALSAEKIIDIGAANNGILAGLVSITAGCSTVEPIGAFFIGIIGAFFYVGGSAFLEKLRIDDVVGAVPVHGFCGIWGTLAPGFFASSAQYANAYYSARADKCAGVFYGGDGSSLGANTVFVLAVIAWAGTLSTLLFLFCKATIGVRVSREVEEQGMDDSKHGGKVFNAVPIVNQEI